ncbi:MAG: metalloregulator ArsR/SmtB family transcription factor [Rhodobacterales bacterium]|nr:metalloregulator ArsR/SmtB family transcription factor [Rhodobacterales bacterium]
MEILLSALRAVAEPTRLRLLALCAESDLTVSELMQILGQSQPRVSRHLKLLTEAGLLERFREGSWVFHRTARAGAEGDGAGPAHLGRRLLDLIPADDPQVRLDRTRLDEVRAQRRAAAADYFSRNAREWNDLRSLHVDESLVERTMGELLPDGAFESLLDIGTGTGRLLELFGPRAAWAEGLDLSRDMLAVARDTLERAGLRHCSVRQGDMFQLPFAGDSFDAVTVHQVLHYVDQPDRAVAEAARVLKPGGRLVVADLAPHDLEVLRTDHAHRRLGFADTEIAAWCAAARLASPHLRPLPGDPLTVTVWMAEKPQS